MKTLKITALALFSLAIILTSCKKEEEPVVTPMAKATVTGFVYADLDLTEAGLEFAPAGTKIIAWVDTKELYLTPDPAVVYPRKYYETTVGSDGKYSFSIEVGNGPVVVHIEPGDFWYDQEIAVDDFETKMYSMGPTTITVVKGQTQIIDLAFL